VAALAMKALLVLSEEQKVDNVKIVFGDRQESPRAPATNWRREIAPLFSEKIASSMREFRLQIHFKLETIPRRGTYLFLRPRLYDPQTQKSGLSPIDWL